MKNQLIVTIKYKKRNACHYFIIKYLLPIKVIELMIKSNIQSVMMDWDMPVRKVWLNLQTIILQWNTQNI